MTDFKRGLKWNERRWTVVSLIVKVSVFLIYAVCAIFENAKVAEVDP